MEYQHTFGDTMRRLRKRRGLSVAAVAARAGVTAAYVSLLERNLRDPRLSTLVTFANIFEVSVPRLLGRPRRGDRLERSSCTVQ